MAAPLNAIASTSTELAPASSAIVERLSVNPEPNSNRTASGPSR